MGEAKNRKEEINNLRMKQNIAFKLRKEFKDIIEHIERTTNYSAKMNGLSNLFRFNDKDIITSFGVAKEEALSILNKVGMTNTLKLLGNESFLADMDEHFTISYEECLGRKRMFEADGKYCVDVNIINMSHLTMGMVAKIVTKMAA